MDRLLDLNSITERQILHIRNTLNTYHFIMREWNKNGASKDFKAEFTSFYMSSQAIMRREENQIAFFNQMKRIVDGERLPNIVAKLYEEMGIGKYEFSFVSKLFHTINPNLPIYDSKVRNFLKQAKQVDFQLYYKDKIRKLEAIANDWDALIRWYESFQESIECKEWICWFDKTFPEFVDISAVKKIDAIIYECGEN